MTDSGSVSKIHTPIMRGTQAPFWADCPQCGTKINEGNGAIVGSQRKVEAAILRHIEETANA